MIPSSQEHIFDLGRGAPTSAFLPVLRSMRSPDAVSTLAIVLACVLVMGVVGLVVTPWQQSVTGRGRVVASSAQERQQWLEATVDGRVRRVAVVEGQSVSAGEVIVEIGDVDPLFLERLESERLLLVVRKTAAEARQSQVLDRVSSLEQARALAMEGAKARVEMAKERVRQAEQALSAATAGLAAAELNLPRMQSLAAQGLRSTRERELAELEAARARADEERARAALASATSEVTSLIADAGRVDKDTTAGIRDARAARESTAGDVATAETELVRLATRIARQETQAVQAPRDGIVRVLLVQQGQLVKQGEPLVELVPKASASAVELWIDGNDAPLVVPGRHVRLQFEGWPALQFVGWPMAPRGTFGGVVSLVDAHDDGTGRFRVLVVPESDQAWPDRSVLRQGVRANGWVLLEQVPLGYELWRRLNAFPPSVAPPPSDKAGGKPAPPPGGGTGAKP